MILHRKQPTSLSSWASAARRRIFAPKTCLAVKKMRRSFDFVLLRSGWQTWQTYAMQEHFLLRNWFFGIYSYAFSPEMALQGMHSFVASPVVFLVSVYSIYRDIHMKIHPGKTPGGRKAGWGKWALPTENLYFRKKWHTGKQPEAPRRHSRGNAICIKREYGSFAQNAQEKYR